MPHLLSKRAKISRDYEDFFLKNLEICNSNPFNAESNPSGYVNLGTPVNDLCEDILQLKLKDIWRLDFDMLGYKQGRGTLKLREAMANVMTNLLESHDPVLPDDLFCLTGVASCIDLMAHCLADPGEVFLVSTPTLGSVKTAFILRSLVEIFPIPVFSEDGNETSELTMEKIIGAYESALTANKVVRGIFMTNPHMGSILSPKLLMDVMTFCSELSLHLVIDEVYALSAFSQSEAFHSILKFRKIPDPARTHLLYGISKDFGIAGLRVGVIHTRCTDLQKCLTQLSYFQCIPSPVMENLTTLLEDLEWCKKYTSTYQSRLAKNNEFCVSYLKKLGIKVRDCPAGFCFWMDLRELCGKSFEGERNLFNFLLKNFHMYIGPGKEFLFQEPGWFQIVTSVKAENLNEGLHRLKEALKNYKSSKVKSQDTV